MLNFEKSFLRNLFDRFSSKKNGSHASRASKAVKGLKARNLSMEPLEERQLLSVTTQELSTIANTYSDFDLSSVTNVIEIAANNLSAQSLVNAINTAQSTSGSDLIVVRTIDQSFTIDLADATQYIEATATTGSITIVGFGETALTITSNNATTLSITSGEVNLGNIKVIGTEAVDENQQPLTTESSIFFIGQSAKVVQANVSTAKELLYTTSVTDNAGAENELEREAIISYRTDTGIWSVDFEMTSDGVGAAFRSYVTGLKSQAEALEVAQNFSEYKDGSYLENSELIHSVTNPTDAEINGNTELAVGDSYLSWAATTANMLYYTGWGNKTGLSEDEIYDYILKNFSNGKYTIEGGVEWYMNGETHDYAPSWQILDKDGNVVTTSSDANKWAKKISDGGNVFGSQYSYDNYAGRFGTYNTTTQLTGMSSVKELLESGYAVAANMQTTTTYTARTYTGVSDVLYDLPNSTMTLASTAYTYDYETGQKIVYDKDGNPFIQDTGSRSIWGYVYNTMLPQNSTNYYAGLYVTNPLDNANSPASEQPNKLVLETMDWVGSEYVTMRAASDDTLSVTKQDGNTWQTGTLSYIDSEKTVNPTWNTTPNTTTNQYSFSGYTVVTVTNEYRINSFVFLAAADGRTPVTSDPYEPNNDALTVDGQLVGEENSSNLGVIDGYREIKNLNLIDYTIDPEDWFKFKTEYTSSSGDYIGVQYSTSLFSGDIEIYLYNRVAGSINLLSDYKAVKTTISEVDIYGNGTNTYELKINLSGLEAGDYYVQVVRANKSVDCKDYTLMLKAASDDEYEINNTLEDITKEDAKANLGALTENVLLSDLVMKQVSTASVEGSEVDGFRFEMTGVGGPNTYVEIQFTDVTHNINDSRLELRVFKEDTEAYYVENPNSWGSSCIMGEVVSQEGSSTTIVRASLDGCDSGVYFIKITGFINAQNLLNYKLNINLSDEGDPAGVGTTSKPDFVVTNPEDQEWEKPVVIAKDQYENHDTEGSGYVYSNDPYFYSKDTMYMNLSYRVAEDSSEKESYEVSVSLVINGKEIKYNDFITIKGEYATNVELRNAIFAKLTNELELTVVNGEAVDNSTSEVWDWTKELKDGMVISVVDNLENIISGYVYQNGNFVAISSGTTLVSGDQVTLANGNVLTYKAVNLSIDGKAVTAVYITEDVLYPADFERNTESDNLIAMKIYTSSGTSDVFYNKAKKGFYTSSGQLVSVSPGTLVSYTNVMTEETSFYTYMKDGTVVYFHKTLIDLSDYKTVVESATPETIGNNTPLKLEDGTIVFYNAGNFYTSATIASGTMLQINGTSEKYRFSGFASTDINSGLWSGTKQFEGKFLKQATYTQALYCQDSSYSNTTPLYFNAVTGYFYKESTFVTKISIANGTLFAKSTSPSSAEDYFVYQTSGTSSAVPYGALWTKAVITTETDFVMADATSTDIYHYQFTEKQFGAFRVDYAGNISEGDKVVMNSGAVNQKTLVYHIASETQTAGFYQITEYDPIFEYTTHQSLSDGEEVVYKAAVAVTANGLRQVYNAEHFFADGTKLLFYRDAVDGGIAASYLKITPSNTDLTQLNLYKNDVQFVIYSADGLSEYNVNNNSASTSFNVFRTQDDFFIPNATVSEMIDSKNPEIYDPNKEYGSTDMVNPNLGPVSGELVVDNLVMLTGNDWFSFELQGKGDDTNSVKIDFIQKLGDLDLYVYAKDDTYPNGYRLVGRSCTLNDTEIVNLNGAEPGTYYVRVVGFSDGTNPNYKLTINGSEPISLEDVTLDLEDAEVINSAALISWNKTNPAEDYIYGDEEEYFISTDIQWISKEDFQTAKDELSGTPSDAEIWEKAEELGLVNSDLAVRYKTEYTINSYNEGELAPETTYFYRVRGNNNNSQVGHTDWTTHKEFTTDDYFNDTKYYAIVIGSSEYSSGSNYNYMYDDAYSVYNTLIANAPQYTAKQICYLNGKVTLQQINQAFADIGAVAGANDVVFVYYTGLGTAASVGPETASYLNTWNNTISVKGFYDLFDTYLNVGEVQVVLNPYYFDSAIANYSPFSYTDFGNVLINGYDTIKGIGAKVSVLTNAEKGENVQLNTVGATIYGYWLDQAMTLKDDNGNFVADTNNDGRLSMEEVNDYVQPRVITESGSLMTPQYLTSDAAWNSILIKGTWKETPEYLAEVGKWFDNDSIVVTTGNDVVDSTDGLTSFREAVDQYLGTTVYGDDTILYDTTVINYDGTDQEFKYGTTNIGVDDTFKIGDTDYRYSIGLVANVGNTGLKKDDKILTDGSKFTLGDEIYTYTLDEDGNIVIKDSEGNENNENDIPYVDVLFKTPTTKIIDVVLEDGKLVSLKQSGIMEEIKVLNTITFVEDIDLYNLEKPIEIDNDALKNVAQDTAVFIDGSSHAGDLVINGNGQTRLFTITYDADITDPAINSGISINFSALNLIGGVADNESEFGSNGGAIYNNGENVYLVNTVIRDNGLRSGEFLYDQADDIHLDFNEDIAEKDTISFNGVVYTAATNSAGKIVFSNNEKILTLSEGDSVIYTKAGEVDGTTYTYTTTLRTEFGGALFNATDGKLTIVNSTISGNTSDNAAVHNEDGVLNIYNSIIAFNDTLAEGTVYDDLYSNVIIGPSYSFIGVHNNNVTLDMTDISADAYSANDIFKDYAKRDFDIVDMAPVINSAEISLAKYSDGTNVEKDIAGYSRSLYGKVDMGAYEWKSYDLTMDTVVTTLGESNDISDGKTSLREAISYAGQNYPLFNALSKYEGQTMTVNGTEVTVTNGQLRKGSNVFTDYSNGDVVVLEDGAQAKISIDSGKTYIETTVTADVMIVFDLDGVISNDFNNNEQAFLDAMDASHGVLTVMLEEGTIGIYDTVIIDGENLKSINATITKAVTDLLITNETGKTNSIFTVDVGAEKVVSLENLTLTNGASKTNYGKSAVVQTTGNLTVNSVVFENNYADNGAAINSKSGTISVTDVIFRNNGVSQNGGAIYAADTTLTIIDSTFENNTASATIGKGGALYLAEGTVAALTNTDLTDNATSVNGSAKGGTIYVESGTELGMTNGLVTGSASYEGGAIYNEGSVALQKVTVNDNTSTKDGGAIYNTGNFYAEYSVINGNSSDTLGGGIYNAGEGRVLLLGDQISGNTGGGIYDVSTYAVSATGKAALNYTVAVANSIISGNTVYGGIDSTGNLYVISSTIVGNINQAHEDLGNGIYYSKLLYLYNTVASYNGGKTNPNELINIDCENVAFSEITGSLIGGAPVFATSSENFVSPNGWASWDLTSNDTTNICEKGEASNVYLTYYDFQGNAKTLLYDYTGRNLRTTVATAGKVIDRGAYQTAAENRNAYIVNTLDEYENGVIIYDDEYVTLLEAISNVSSGEADSENITFADYSILEQYQEIRGQEHHFGNLSMLTYGAVKNLFLDGSDAFYNIDGAITNAVTGITKNVTIDANANANADKTPFIVNEAGTYVTLKNMSVTGGYASVTASAIPSGDAGYGGAFYIRQGYLNLENVTIYENAAALEGGAIYVNGGKLRLTNSLIYNNEAEGFNIGSGEYGGGGIFAENHASITIVNSTIAKNTAQNFSGIYMISSSIAMYNSIVLGNQGKIDEGLDFYSKDVNYSLIHNNIVGIMSETQNLNGRNGNHAGTSTNPIAMDRVFTDYANNVFTINNLTGNKTSLAVNTGSNFYARDVDGHLLLTDILGSARFTEVVDENGKVTYLGIVDIGAYENTNVKDELSSVVTTLDDITDNTDGLISLREAIENAKELGTVVTFDAEACKNNTESFDGQYIIHLNDTTRNTITIGAETDKDYTITIDASSIAGGVIIDGAGIIENIFSVVDDTLELKAITLTGARAFSGSVLNISGTGNASITNGLIYGNTATSYGSAINLTGRGSLTLLNTTIAKNTGSNAAVYVASGNSTLKIMNSIIAENIAENGVADLDIVSKGDRTISTSLIGQGGGQISYANLVNTSFVGTFANPIDPGFLDSATNDFSLSSTSIALNAGANASVGRPGYLSTLPKDLQSALGNLTVKLDLAGNDRIYNGTVDMGAYEFNKPFEDPSTVVTTLTDVIDPVDGKISLREAINYAGTVFYNSETGVTYTLSKTITFDSAAIAVNDAELNLPARTITLDATKGTIVVDKDVTIDASSVDGGIIIDANSSYNTEDPDYRRVFEFTNADGTTAQIVALTLTGGDAGSENGGAIYQFSGNLYVINSVIYKNSAYRGGAIYSTGLSTYLNVVNTTITKNNATANYGGIFSSNSNVTVANTLVAWSMSIDRQAFYSGDYTFDSLLNDQYGAFTVDNFITKGTYYSSFFSIADTGYSINDINASKCGVIGSPLNPWFSNWDNNDFTLTKTDTGSNSVAINGGTNDLAVYADGTSLTRDITGGSRFIGKIEIGAYETVLSTGEIPSVIVTTTADIVDEYDGLISLREAVTYAGHYGLGNRITFAENLVDKNGHTYTGANAYQLSHTIVLDSTLTISKDLKIDSSSFGKNMTITMADDVDQRLIYVDTDEVEMIGLILTQRYTERSSNGDKFTIAQGGAIYLRTGTLTVRNTLLYDNSASAGAAIYVASGEKVALVLRNVTVTNNYGTTGAIFSDGNGTVRIYNTIVARNNMTDANYNDVVVKYSDMAKQTERLDLVGNFFQRETAGTELNQLGAYNQINGNFIGYYSTVLGKYSLDNEANNYLFVDWENGDFTLKDNSLAVNGGNNEEVVDLSELDCSGGQRLYSKKVDIGAFENHVTQDSPYNTDGSQIVVTTNIDIVTTADGLTSLREAIDLAERLYDIDVRDKMITFSQLYLGDNPVMQLADKTLSINRPIIIDASSIGSFMIDCDYKDCGFVIDTNLTDEKVTLKNIAIKDGRNYNGGGLYLRSGSLELLNVLICASQAKVEGTGTTYGGGIYAASETDLTLVNCTVANNEATYGGGIYAAANTELTILNSIIAQNKAAGPVNTDEDDIVISGAVSETASAQNRIAYTLIGNSKKMYDILGNAGTNVIGYGPDNKVNPGFTDSSNYKYTLNPMYNRTTGGYDNPAKGKANNSIATEYGIIVDLTKALYNNPADMGAYQIAREKASTIVTTTEDIVDSTDNLISLREAVLNYCTDNIAFNNAQQAEHSTPIGFSEYYSNGFMLPDLSPITFSKDLFEGTTGGIVIELDSSIDISFDEHARGLKGFAGDLPLMDILIDASSVAALGGVTIDGGGVCTNLFTLDGFCYDKAENNPGKRMVELELIGLTLTGASGYSIVVDPYSMMEMHNCVVYGNGGGVMVWDENNANFVDIRDGDNKARDKWYGIANICNSTIVENDTFGVGNNGEAKIYNSIVVLNGYTDISVLKTTNAAGGAAPAYRQNIVYNTIYCEANNFRLVVDSTLAINESTAQKDLFVNVEDQDYRLAEGSAAINIGLNKYTYINKVSHADQEVDRNGANRVIGGTVDLGAYEYLDASFKDVRRFNNSGVIVDTELDGIDYTDGKTSLREAVAYASQFSDVLEYYDYNSSDYSYSYIQTVIGANKTSICYNKVVFDTSMDGKTIVLDSSLGAISITTDLWITASNLENGVTIDGNNATNAFYVNMPSTTLSKIDVILEGMNYTNGYAQKGGAIYIAQGNVLVKNSKFYKNEASQYGGAIYAEAGELTIYGSQIGGNKAAYYGGVVNVLGTLLIVNSQIAENYGTVGATDAYSVSAANKDVYYYTAINQRGTRGTQETPNIFGKMAITNIDGQNTDGRFNYIAEVDGRNINTDIDLNVDKIFAGNWVNGVWTYGEADGEGGLDVIWNVPVASDSEAVDESSYATALAAVALEDDEFNWLFDEE